MTDTTQQEIFEDTRSPIAESLDSIEEEILNEFEAETAESEAESAEAQVMQMDPAVLIATIGQGACAIADGACSMGKVSPLTKGEKNNLSAAVGGVVPYIVPREMDAKQLAIASLAMVCLSIAMPRMAELKNKPKNEKTKVEKSTEEKAEASNVVPIVENGQRFS